jgi:hypothetical protein
VVFLCSYRSYDGVPGRSGGGGKRKGFFSGPESNNRKPSPAAETLPVVAYRKRSLKTKEKKEKKRHQ